MYFDKIGKVNSRETAAMALKTAVEKKIKYIVVASSRGDTAKLLTNTSGISIICVSHANGYPIPGNNEMSKAVRDELADLGIKVLTTTHVLSGAERGLSKTFAGVYPVEIIAHSLRMLGQGTKVAVEVAIMALDAGLIPYGESIIALGGTVSGADTALIITPSHASSIFETTIHEIICKPSRYNPDEPEF